MYEQISCKSDTCIYLMCKDDNHSCFSMLFWQNKRASISKGATLSYCSNVILRYYINVFGDVINFVEATASNADKHLTQLWKVMADIKQLSGNILLDNQQCWIS